MRTYDVMMVASGMVLFGVWAESRRLFGLSVTWDVMQGGGLGVLIGATFMLFLGSL